MVDQLATLVDQFHDVHAMLAGSYALLDEPHALQGRLMGFGLDRLVELMGRLETLADGFEVKP